MKDVIEALLISIVMFTILYTVCFIVKLLGFAGVVFGVFGFSVLLTKMIFRGK